MATYLPMNPLAEHNANIAMSSKQVPMSGTGNFYDGVGGRTFTQGGGGGLYYGSNVGEPGSEYSRGTYSPVVIGNQANASSPASVKFSGGGGKRKLTKRKSRKYSRSRKHSMLKSRKMKTLRRKLIMRKRRQQTGGAGAGAGGEMVVGWGAANGSSVPSGPNAAYSVGGTVTPQTTALANPAQITAYNSCANRI
jgi:hypothetical protein